MTTKPDPRDKQRYTLRLKDDLRQALIAEAKRQMRSLRAEITFRLQRSLDEQSAPR